MSYYHRFCGYRRLGRYDYEETCRKCGLLRKGNDWVYKPPSNSGCEFPDPTPTMYGIFTKQRLTLWNYDIDTHKACGIVEDIPYTDEDYARIKKQYKDQLLDNCLVETSLLYDDYDVCEDSPYPLLSVCNEMIKREDY